MRRRRARPPPPLLTAAGVALLAGWLVERLPAGWGVPIAGLALAVVVGLILRELAATLPGEIHLARAWLGLPTDRAPAAYVRGLFDSYAARYDRHLFAELDYRVPNLLRDLVGDRLAGRPADTADLGCGTGGLGPLFRGLSRRLDGVDLSPRMLERARRRGLYDELVEGDLLDFLRERSGRYDLLLAADVLPYLGDPGPFLAAAAAALRDGGLLALSAEVVPGVSHSLGRSGRFAHDPALLEAAAAAVGLALAERFDASLRREAGRPVTGAIMLLRKNCL